MKYAATIEYLYGLQKYGMKFGLDNMKRLMSLLGNPHTSFRSVHVAGTNGKGSTSAMIESMLRTSGMKTGLFTSPHLVSFTERIRINGTEIAEGDVIDLAAEVKSAADGIEDFCPTFFEVVTAMAFLFFSKEKVEWAVIETGMGGRLDATNIIMPEASVITSIAMDHSEFLGRTIREIAGEKAGIIKGAVPVITAAQQPEAMDVLRRRAAETGSALSCADEHFSAEMVSDSPEGISFNYYGQKDYTGLQLPLAGDHQVRNAGVAIRTVEVLSERCSGPDPDIRSGLKQLRWPGRLEMIKDVPPVLIDGAHNPAAAVVLARYLEKLLTSRYRRIILVAGVMADKDIPGILGPLLPLAAEIICASPAYGRAAAPDHLAAHAAAMGYNASQAISIAEAINMAERRCKPGDLIVITGSFYTIGEAKETLVQKGVLSRLREC